MKRSTHAIAIMALTAATLLIPSKTLHAQTDPPTTQAAFQWKRSTPEAQGVDSEMLLRSIRRIRDEAIDIRSLILIRNDHIVLELYVHPYTPDTIHNVKSVSKSVLSALVGIALREGIIEDLDRPVREYFPDYFPDDAEDSRNRITLRHLLTMTSGLDLDENGPKMQNVFQSDDWIRTTFATDMIAIPGERFEYSTPLTHTMVGVLTEASGRPLLELADEHLFGPLEFGALQWSQGPQGYYFGGAELFLRPRDMAKFGLLYLNGGQWQDRQIVPADWVDKSTRNQLPEGGSSFYGYWWWTHPDGGGFKAMGWGGQGIMVRHDLRLVTVVTAGEFTAEDRVFRDFNPGMIRDEPLPPNPEAVAALHTLVEELENPEPISVPVLPEIASEISSKSYRLDANPRDYRELTFRFEEGAPIASVTAVQGDESHVLEIGLDGVYRLTETGTRGPMPAHNRYAMKGRWTADDEFVIDAHTVSDPIHGTWTVRFEGDRLEAEVVIHPTRQRLTLTGQSSSGADN